MTIVLTDVTKAYGASPPAVRGVSLEIQDGEFFTLLQGHGDPCLDADLRADRRTNAEADRGQRPVGCSGGTR